MMPAAAASRWPTSATQLGPRAAATTSAELGAEFGGFWLLLTQITQLRRLPEYYSPEEAPLVEFAIEAYLAAQIREFSLI